MIQRPRPFECCLVALFFALCLIGVLNHELWRDEFQSWMIARDSATLTELFQNAKYESHPALWHLLLYLISRFTRDPLGMQILHVVIATSAVCLFVFLSPFTRLQKACFTFGYFPLFEYGIISRSYSLGMMLIFLFCVLFCMHADLLYIAITIALLCQTNLVGLLLAGCLAGFIIMNSMYDKAQYIAPPGRKRMLASCLVVYSGVVFSFVQLRSPAMPWGLSHWAGQSGAVQVKRAIATLWESHVPIPPLRLDFWENNSIASVDAQFILSVFLFTALVHLFKGRPCIRALYIGSTVVLIAFFSLVIVGYMRHHGYLFLATVACLWLYADYLTGCPGTQSARRTGVSACVTALFGLQMVCGVHAYAMDIRHPFSASKETADYIRRNGLDTLEIVGHIDYAASAVVGHLDAKAYYVERGERGTFIRWDERRKEDVDAGVVLEKAEQLANLGKRGVLLIEQRGRFDRLLRERKGDYSMAKVAEFPHGIVLDEGYSLYVLKYPPRKAVEKGLWKSAWGYLTGCAIR